MIAKWRWFDHLKEAADNDRPIAYVVAAISVALVIFVVMYFARDYYRSWKGTPVRGGLFKAFALSLVAAGFPLCFLWELVPRLLK